MKTLVTTTALLLSLSAPSISPAQITGATSPEAAPQQGTNQGFDFLGHPGQPNLFVSELIGQDVLARRAHDDVSRAGGQPATAQPTEAQATTGAGQRADQTVQSTDDPVAGDLGGDAFSSVASDGSTNMHLMGTEDLAELNIIGQISEVVLTGEGQLLAIVVDLGVREVSLPTEQVTFSYNPDDLEQLHIVLSAGPELLEEAPEFDRMAMRQTGTDTNRSEPVARHTATPDRGETRDQRHTFAAPQMQREGYHQLALSEVSVDMLMDATVYDVNDDEVGTVQDMVLDQDGVVSGLVIEFGGFLGIGSSQAVLNLQELTVLTTGGLDTVRLYVDATRDQIQELPPHERGN